MAIHTTFITTVLNLQANSTRTRDAEYAAAAAIIVVSRGDRW